MTSAELLLVITARNEASAALRQVGQQVDSLEGQVAGATGRMGGFFQNMLSTTGGFLLAQAVNTAADGVRQLGSAMVGGNAQFESYRTQLAVLLKGSDDMAAGYARAAARMQELKQFAAQTPFELPDVVKASRMMEVFGLEGEKAMARWGMSGQQMRTIIGDVASGVGASFSEIAMWFGRFAQGDVGEALERMRELGIVSKEQLQSMGIEFNKAGQMITPVAEAFPKLLAYAQQTFGGMMDEQSRTFDGMISNLHDFAGEAMRTLGQPIFERVKEGLQSLLNLMQTPTFQDGLASWAAGIDTALGVTGRAFGGILDTIGGLVSGFQQTFGAIASEAGAWGVNIVVNLAAGIINAANTILSAAMSVIASILSFWLAPGSPPKVAPDAPEWGAGLAREWVSGMARAIPGLMGGIAGVVEGALHGALSAAGDLADLGARTFEDFLRGFEGADFGILRTATSALRGVLDSLVTYGEMGKGDVLATLLGSREQIAEAISQMREMGGASDDLLSSISGAFGSASGYVRDYLDAELALIPVQDQLAQANERVKATQEELNRLQKEGRNVSLARRETELGWQGRRLEIEGMPVERNEIKTKTGTRYEEDKGQSEAKRAAQDALRREEEQTRFQWAQEDLARDKARTAIEDQLEAERGQVDALKEQEGILQRNAQWQEQFLSALQETAKIVAEMNKPAAGGGGGGAVGGAGAVVSDVQKKIEEVRENQRRAQEAIAWQNQYGGGFEPVEHVNQMERALYRLEQTMKPVSDAWDNLKKSMSDETTPLGGSLKTLREELPRISQAIKDIFAEDTGKSTGYKLGFTIGEGVVAGIKAALTIDWGQLLFGKKPGEKIDFWDVLGWSPEKGFGGPEKNKDIINQVQDIPSGILGAFQKESGWKLWELLGKPQPWATSSPKYPLGPAIGAPGTSWQGRIGERGTWPSAEYGGPMYQGGLGVNLAPMLGQVGPPTTTSLRQLGNLGEAIGGALGGAGEAIGNFIQMIQGLPGIVGAALGSLGGTIGSVFGGIGELIGGAMGSVGETVEDSTRRVGSVLGSIGEAVGNLAGTIGAGLGGALGGLGELIGGALGGVGETVGGWYGTFAGGWSAFWGGVGAVLGDIWSGFTGVVSEKTAAIQSTFDGWKAGFQTGWETLWSAVSTFFSDQWNGFKTKPGEVLAEIQSGFDSWKANFEGGWKSFWDGIGTALSTPIEAAKGLVLSAFKAIQDAYNNLKSIIAGIPGAPPAPQPTPEQYGGLIDRPTLALIGEAGAEVIVPLKAVRELLQGKPGMAKGLKGQPPEVLQAAGQAAHSLVALAAGGIVTKPTVALVGEREPEAVIPLGKLGELEGRVPEGYPALPPQAGALRTPGKLASNPLADALMALVGAEQAVVAGVGRVADGWKQLPIIFRELVGVLGRLTDALGRGNVGTRPTAERTEATQGGMPNVAESIIQMKETVNVGLGELGVPLAELLGIASGKLAPDMEREIELLGGVTERLAEMTAILEAIRDKPTGGGGGSSGGVDWRTLVHRAGEGGGNPFEGVLPAAAGGLFNSPTLALIGEQGPEAVVPLSKAFGSFAEVVKQMGGQRQLAVIGRQAGALPGPAVSEVLGGLPRLVATMTDPLAGIGARSPEVARGDASRPTRLGEGPEMSGVGGRGASASHRGAPITVNVYVQQPTFYGTDQVAAERFVNEMVWPALNRKMRGITGRPLG